MMIKYLLAIATLATLSFANPTDEAAVSYIDQYYELAIIEMYRTGIPASVTIAQGMHESSLGQSNLATIANNHFGIKCKSYWTGKTYAHKDDDLDAEGNLIKSCFRAYDTATDSYVDHSNFLTNTAHYRPCFKYKQTEYAKWALALKQCGYATDPNYADKLIKKIEQYHLYYYDTSPNPLESVR